MVKSLKSEAEKKKKDSSNDIKTKTTMEAGMGEFALHNDDCPVVISLLSEIPFTKYVQSFCTPAMPPIFKHQHHDTIWEVSWRMRKRTRNRKSNRTPQTKGQ